MVFNSHHYSAPSVTGPLFHIPHIPDSTTDSLSFKDLCSCVLVIGEWRPILWKDVVTCRSIPTSGRHWFCLDYTLKTHLQQTLEKYAHRIALSPVKAHALFESSAL